MLNVDKRSLLVTILGNGEMDLQGETLFMKQP